MHSSAFYLIIFKTASASLLSISVSSGYDDGKSIPCALPFSTCSLVSDGSRSQCCCLQSWHLQSLSPFMSEFSSFCNSFTLPPSQFCLLSSSFSLRYFLLSQTHSLSHFTNFLYPSSFLLCPPLLSFLSSCKLTHLYSNKSRV